MSYPLTALISDLHSNMPALEVALADALGRGVQRFVCLGDVVGYGAEPRPTLDWVMQLIGAEGPAQVPAGLPRAGEALETGLCLRGNHEDGLLTTPEDFNPKARAAIEWTRDELASGPAAERARFFDFLGDLEPAHLDPLAGSSVQYAHGSPRDPLREYVIPRDSQDPEKLAALFAPMTRGACFIGHSHVPAVYYEDGRIYLPKVPAGETSVGPFALGARDAAHPERPRAIINVGSVGQPRDGDPRLSYVLFDGENITFVRLSYDVDAAAERIRAVADLPEYLAERLSRGR
jgi:diadenosine tetraphosphatase ApaH/serine/threonine PP2A family protein phosphatase